MNKPIYQTMKVVFVEPIQALNEMFSDTQSWGVSTLKEWIDGYESTYVCNLLKDALRGLSAPAAWQTPEKFFI